MSSPRVTYVPHPDATLEAEINALAGVYSFILDSHAMRKAAAKCDQHRDGDDGTKIKGDSAYGRSIP